MSTLTFNLSNTAPFVGEQSAAVLGKNGFDSVIGLIRPVVTAASVSNSNLVLTVSNLHLLYDDNFDCHVLEARNNTQLIALDGRAPDNLLNYVLNVKSAPNSAGALFGAVGYESTLTTVTSNITDFNIAANTISIDFGTNAAANTIRSLLVPAPFHVNLNQIVDKRFSSSNTFFFSGDSRIISNTYNVVGLEGSANLALSVYPSRKGFISVYLNDNSTAASPVLYDFSTGNNYITYTIATGDRKVVTYVQDYTVPHIEPKDLLYIQDNQQFVTVNAVNYISSSPSYNASMYASDFYKIKLDNNIAANVSGSIVTNVSEDLIADIASVNAIANTVTLTYNNADYTYDYAMSYEGIYNMAPFSYTAFKDIEIIDGKLSVPTEAGIYIFKVTSINEFNRQSLPVTKTINLTDIPLGQVANLTLEEILFRDRIKGVMSRISGSFDHIQNRNVTDYEVSYKINLISGTEPHPSGMTDFNSFKVNSKGIGTDNKVRFTIDNIDIGNFGNIYEMEVRVLPLNGSVAGLEQVTTLQLQGKSQAPLPVTLFNVSQTDNSLVFEIDYPADAQDTLDELDILHTKIKYRNPTTSIATNEDRLSAYNSSDTIMLLPHPLTRQEVSLDRIGEGNFTFTARTVDTSGNESDEVLARNLTVSLPTTYETIAAWNEKDSTNNVKQGTYNLNFGDSPFVGYTESDNGGFVYDIDPITSNVLGNNVSSTIYEDANATSSGFRYTSNTDPCPDHFIITSANAQYIGPVRDLGEVVRGSLVVSSVVLTNLQDKWLEITNDLLVGVTDSSPSANIIYDADFEIGTVVGYNNTEHTFSFSSNNQTIVDNSANARVYAIVNPGQAVIGERDAANDTSNIYSYALIAGAVNAHAIELAGVYYANGEAVPGGNTTVESVLANITQSGNSYRLVDLQQYNDEYALQDFEPDLPVSKNVYVRFSSSNVFLDADAGSSKPHGNVDVDLFDSTDLEGNWTKQYGGLRQFRYFQVRVDVDIDAYGETANSCLDQLNYEVLSPRKTYTTTINSDDLVGENILVDYSATNYFNIPAVFCQVLSEGSYIAKTRNLTNETANVYIVNTQNGNIVTDSGIEVLVSVIGA